MPDRKKSPLVADEAPWEGPKRAPADAPVPPRDQQKQQPKQQTEGQTVVPIQEGRRKRVGTRGVDPFELRGCNFNLPIITRRALATFAAEHDVDKQDVVNDALIRYLALFGVEVPRNRDELEAQKAR